MRSPGINGEGELRGQPANPVPLEKWCVKTECVCVCVWTGRWTELVKQYCTLHALHNDKRQHGTINTLRNPG